VRLRKLLLSTNETATIRKSAEAEKASLDGAHVDLLLAQ
jgi:hypothetical protein